MQQLVVNEAMELELKTDEPIPEPRSGQVLI